jgi:hypothetical protein
MYTNVSGEHADSLRVVVILVVLDKILFSAAVFSLDRNE